MLLCHCQTIALGDNMGNMINLCIYLPRQLQKTTSLRYIKHVVCYEHNTTLGSDVKLIVINNNCVQLTVRARPRPRRTGVRAVYSKGLFILLLGFLNLRLLSHLHTRKEAFTPIKKPMPHTKLKRGV